MINNKLQFYHYTSWLKENINLGQSYETDWPLSNYWKNKIKWDVRYLKKEILIEDFEVIKFLERKFKNEHDGKELFDQFIENISTKKAEEELRKENIFENIRGKEFPELPSRRNCMFLIGLAEDLEKYLNHYKLNILNRTIVIIEILDQEKKIVKVNSKFLNCNFMAKNVIKIHARDYWRQKDINESYCEYLFRGKFRIVEIIDSIKFQ